MFRNTEKEPDTLSVYYMNLAGMVRKEMEFSVFHSMEEAKELHKTQYYKHY